MNSWADLQKAISESPARSAWARGVRQYASELVEEADSDWGLDFAEFVGMGASQREKRLLNGAQNWVEYSEGGSSLVYDSEVAERLCTPSELKRLTLKSGLKDSPNPRENWLQCQGRALHQACILINTLMRDL